MKAFYFLDLDKSFLPGGPGSTERKLIDLDGKPRLSRMAWNVGMGIYEKLTGNEEPPTAGEIESFVKTLEPGLSDFVEDFIELHRLGKVQLEGREPDEGAVDYDSWRSADWLWKMDSQRRLMEAVKQSEEQAPAYPPAFALVLALGHLESAVAASYWDDVQAATDGVLCASQILDAVRNEELRGTEEHRNAPQAISFAILGADARHRESRSMREQVFVWLDDHMSRFSSMDAAADAIAGKVVPVKWRTARDWIGQWKKLRSAGRA